MQTIISQMLEQYRADSLGEERNALKEVVQEVALCGLSRAGFFQIGGVLRRNGAPHFLRARSFFGRSEFFSDRTQSVLRPENIFSDFGERDPRDGPPFHRGRKGKVCGVKYPVGVFEGQHQRTHFKLF